MSAACQFCNDTGSLSKDVYGYRDCVHCDTAKERNELDKWIRQNDFDAAGAQGWLIYQHGKASALEQAAKDSDVSYELMQDDEFVAGASGCGSKQEIQHYAMLYGQDGPVEIIEVTRRKVVAVQ